MELYATGFNAWNQLRFQEDQPPKNEPDDLHAFACVMKDEFIGEVTPSLSYSLVETSSGPKTAGILPERDAAFRARCGRFAQAANGFVVVSVDARTICQYSSVLDALAGAAAATHTFPSDIVQVVAYDVGFAALDAKGCVWTWGDERYPGCLGREVSGGPSAAEPGRISDLEDLPTGNIAKIAAGGYILAALTSGDDLYCWGGHPGREAIVDEDISSGPVPVAVEENSDVVDVAVGESHLIALTDRGEVFVIGENSNGQLGLGADSPLSVRSWSKIELCLMPTQEVVGVAAGARCSFIKTSRKNETSHS